MDVFNLVVQLKGVICMTEYRSTRHCVYRLTYHLVFVTKYRKPVISDGMGDFLKEEAARLCRGYGCELVSAETDRDHMHLLVSMNPSDSVTVIVRSLKTQLSKEVHSHPVYGPEAKRLLKGNAPFWSPSYFVATTGSVSMETVKSYIESQRTDEHCRKYTKRSGYWEK